MKRPVLAVICIAALIGAGVFVLRHNRSEPQPVVEAETEALVAPTTQIYSASVRLMPAIGTNIATPGQFKNQQ